MKTKSIDVLRVFGIIALAIGGYIAFVYLAGSWKDYSDKEDYNKAQEICDVVLGYYNIRSDDVCVDEALRIINPSDYD